MRRTFKGAVVRDCNGHVILRLETLGLADMTMLGGMSDGLSVLITFTVAQVAHNLCSLQDGFVDGRCPSRQAQSCELHELGGKADNSALRQR